MKLEFLRQKLNIYRTTLRAKKFKEIETEVYLELDDGTLYELDSVKLVQENNKFYIVLK